MCHRRFSAEASNFLLSALRSQWYMPKEPSDEDDKAYHKRRNVVRMKVINIVYRWISKYWDQDFLQQPNVKEKLHDFADEVESTEDQIAQSLIKKLRNKMASVDKAIME